MVGLRSRVGVGVWWVVWVVAVAGCHEDESAGEGGDSGIDAATIDAAAPDAMDLDALNPDGPPLEPDAGNRPTPGTRVDVDLTAALEPGPDAVGAGPARAFVAQAAADLVTGPTAQGRVGDYVLDNDRVRFVVEGNDRVIGPCPYGGNVIDADIRRGGDEPGGDMVGEICVLVNLGQTLDPQDFEILRDGSDGGAAVLAVTGRTTINDFINLAGLVSVFLPGPGLDIGYDIDAELGVTITQYYVLRPGDTGLHVVTALRNDGELSVHLPYGHLIDSGGAVEVLNPLSPTGGYGNSGFGADALGGVPLTAVAFNGQGGGHAYVPVPRGDLGDPLPTSGRYLWVAGVVASVLDIDALLSVLLAPAARIPSLPGLIHLEPGEMATRYHWHFIGDGSPHSLMDPAWRVLGVATVAVDGEVRVADAPRAGVRVSALDAEGRLVNQAFTDEAGRYAMRVPAGAHTLSAFAEGHRPVTEPIAIDGAADVTLDPLVLEDAARLIVNITDPDGQPVPGRVAVLCDGPCPQIPLPTQRDVDTDGPLPGFDKLIFTGVDGRADLAVAPGRYRVVVSRGPDWSAWPPDAVGGGGAPVELVAGEETVVAAEIAPVIDRRGWLSGDFHVHGINSPDAPVTLEDRVRTFLAEGVDVLVSTDHDYVTDYRPTISALGADAHLIGVIGVELTTFDYGHYNSFPLVVDPMQRNGGALDWAGGRGPGLTPDAIFRGLEEAAPGERVIQINHPQRGGIGALDVDLLRGVSRADPTVFRLPAREPDPETGDTGLWSERFTAIEIMNGNSEDSFNGTMRWWLTLVGRGFTPTATAVSDTHRTITTQSGGPRSYVWVGAENDRPETFDDQVFARAVNAGRLMGSNGPFVELTVAAGEAVGTLGDTVTAAGDAPVEVRVDVQTPAWMTVGTVDLYVNVVDALGPDPAEFDEAPLPPTVSAELEPAGPPEVAAQGAETHHRQRWTARIELDLQADAYIVAVVRGTDSMYPVNIERDVGPKAFTNPVYVDVDGGGYDRFPLAALAAQPAMRAMPSLRADLRRPMTIGDVRLLMQELAHDHAGH